MEAQCIETDDDGIDDDGIDYIVEESGKQEMIDASEFLSGQKLLDVLNQKQYHPKTMMTAVQVTKVLSIGDAITKATSKKSPI